MIKLYWIFYKSLLPMNIGISLTISTLITFYLYLFSPIDYSIITLYIQNTILVFLSGGLILSLVYHEFYKNKFYRFCNNHAITRVQLFLSSLLINSIIGFIILILLSYA